MKISFFLVFSAIIIGANAQNNITHYDQSDQKTDSLHSYYFVVNRANPNLATTGFYTDTKKPRYVELKKSEKESSRVYYYPTSEILATGNFKYAHPVGKWKIQYPDGKPLAEIDFLEEHKFGEEAPFHLIQYWDGSGNQVVVDGNGTVNMNIPFFCGDAVPGEGKFFAGAKEGLWKGAFCDGGTYEEQYEKGMLAKGSTTKNGKTYSYENLFEMPAPVGGMEKFYKYVGNKMRYPAEARRHGIEGKAVVEFEVDEQGVAQNFVITKSTGSVDLDTEAMRVVSSAPGPWKAATSRGIPVKFKMAVPLTFKLG